MIHLNSGLPYALTQGVCIHSVCQQATQSHCWISCWCTTDVCSTSDDADSAVVDRATLSVLLVRYLQLGMHYGSAMQCRCKVKQAAMNPNKKHCRTPKASCNLATYQQQVRKTYGHRKTLHNYESSITPVNPPTHPPRRLVTAVAVYAQSHT